MSQGTHRVDPAMRAIARLSENNCLRNETDVPGSVVATRNALTRPTILAITKPTILEVTSIASSKGELLGNQ